MFIKGLPPKTSISYSKTGVYRGLLFFIFLIQTIDCVYSLERVPSINVLSKNVKNIDFFFFYFYSCKNFHILHGHGFVMLGFLGTTTQRLFACIYKL